ncbi:MAG TPA: peptide ABC transporter permease [Acidobacteria bacterium]|jgi:putative ABC transport system permease protein|nr:ABC transporter permease [Arenicellales bacterium]HCQ98091.1 peptide ABC transporter permease [Acidobacteriota bacterium]|tara:strand:+ start:1544 stop:2803 length:1260 start_codon:yes stop_codon:yes gene_type:complete
MAVLNLAWKSLLNRRFSALLTIGAIALSVMLLIGVERIRTETRASFANTISGTDLIVGARSGSIQLLLFSVFRIGNATNNITWESYQDIAGHDAVAWTVPISLGDSHRGFRVLGTDHGYFEHYRFGRKQPLTFAQGGRFEDVFDAVLGAEVASELVYRLDQDIAIAHGAGKVTFHQHDDKPFSVVGILAPTGTPVDNTIHVSLEGIEAIHVDWRDGAPMPGTKVSAEQARKRDLSPKAITAFLVGLKSKIATFQLQRKINEYRAEPLLAILPGVALTELWGVMGVAEQMLLVVSVFVVLVGLSGMLVALLTSLNERRREMAVLRSVGARRHHIFALMVSEAVVLTLIGIGIGLALLYILMVAAQPVLQDRFGILIALGPPGAYELGLLSLVLLAGAVVGLIPAYRAYRNSLADGLTIRV